MNLAAKRTRHCLLCSPQDFTIEDGGLIRVSFLYQSRRVACLLESTMQRRITGQLANSGGVRRLRSEDLRLRETEYGRPVIDVCPLLIANDRREQQGYV